MEGSQPARNLQEAPLSNGHGASGARDLDEVLDNRFCPYYDRGALGSGNRAARMQDSALPHLNLTLYPVRVAGQNCGCTLEFRDMHRRKHYNFGTLMRSLLTLPLQRERMHEKIKCTLDALELPQKNLSSISSVWRKRTWRRHISWRLRLHETCEIRSLLHEKVRGSRRQQLIKEWP